MIPKFATLPLLVGWLGLGGAAWSQVPQPHAADQELGPLTDEEFRLPLDSKTADDVERLIPLLNSPTFKQREEATKALTEVGAPAFAKLREAYNASEDLEIRLRIETVVRAAYLNRYVFDRNGFLGVQLGSIDAPNQKGQRRTQAENGVRIDKVLSDTAAHRAGLQAEDVVTAVNGAPLMGNGQDVVQRFRASIPQFTPGTKIRLAVLRGEKTLTIDAVIGRSQEGSVRNTPFAPLYYEVEQRFPEWWYKYFAPSESAPAPQR